MSASEGKATRQAGFKCSDSTISAYRFVTVDASNSTAAETVVALAGAGELALGVTYESTAAADRTVGVNLEGVCFLEVDGSGTAIAAGDRLKSDADGMGVKSAADGEEYGAIALAASSADGDVIPVMIARGTQSVPA
ncbi:DUF2190 family protein [Candidatus Sumerlaeota bacterium]|nr:DUF2190 family protein [Candidatus Sumerlaeota bacterium]